MARTLSFMGTKLLDDMPPYLQDSPEAQAVENALGNELQRIQDAADRFRSKVLPSSADDEFRTMGIWELTLGLPVEPPDATLDERRTKVLANLRALRSAAGSTWEDLITLALNSGAWSYTENNDYSVTITFPYAAGGYTVQSVEALIRKITPAHIAVLASYSQGFIVADSFTDAAASVVDTSVIGD